MPQRVSPWPTAMVASGATYVAAGVPFVAWLGFATLLAERIRRDNPANGR